MALNKNNSVSFNGLLYFFKNILRKKAYMPSSEEFNLGIALAYPTRKTIYANSFNDSKERIEWKNAKGRLFIRPGEYSSPHIVITGSSGNGKSTILKKLISELSHSSINILIFDSQSEHYDLAKALKGKIISPLGESMGIFALDGLSAGERIQELTSLFSNIFGLGYIQANLLHSCMRYIYTKSGMRSMDQRHMEKIPCFSDLIDELRLFIANSKSATEKVRLVSIMNKLYPIANYFSSGRMDSGELFNGIACVAMDQIRNDTARYIFMHEMLSRLYNHMRSMPITHRLSNYIAIDELDLILNDYDSSSGILKRIVREGRKYGIGMIVSTHMGSKLPRDMIENATTIIAFNSKDPSERRYMSSVISNGDSSMEKFITGEIEKLEKYRFLLCSPDFSFPIKAMLDNEEASRLSTSSGIPQHIIPEAALKNPTLHSDALGIGFTESKISELKESGRLSSSNIKGVEWLMLKNNSLSIEHEICVNNISKWLSDNGIKNYILDNSKGPDIVAYPFGLKIAVEYETGKKSAYQTSAMLKKRVNDYGFVVVLVNSKSYKFYKSALETKGIMVIEYDGLLHN